MPQRICYYFQKAVREKTKPGSRKKTIRNGEVGGVPKHDNLRPGRREK